MGRDPIGLEQIRRNSMTLILGVLWLQALLIGAACWLNGAAMLAPVAGGLATAGVVTGLARLNPGGGQGRIAAGVGLMATISMLVGVLSGSKLQVDMHMYYFAALALLVTTCDWRVIAAGTATVAVHHIVLNFVLPSLIYPGGADMVRLALHAVILVVEACALAWLARKIETMFATVEAETARVEAARQLAEANHSQAVQASRDAADAQTQRQEDIARPRAIRAKSPRPPTTCPDAPSTRPRASRRPRAPWTRSPRRSAKRPTAPGTPARSWPRPRTTPSSRVRSCWTRRRR